MKKGLRAFSLTELLIVLVVIALLFAAMAPIVTKRHIAETHETESIWNYVTGDSERNAYFDPGSETWSSSVFMGMVAPTATTSTLLGKLAIATNDITYDGVSHKQPHIQFRFSKDSQQQGRGLNAATLSVTNNNLIFGPDPNNFTNSYSTVYGSSIFTNNRAGASTFLTLLGGNIAQNIEVNQLQYITAIGNNIIQNIDSRQVRYNILIGSDVAENINANVRFANNVIVGSSALNHSGIVNNNIISNVIIGANAGNVSTSSNNTIIGSLYSGSNASNNTIVGYGAYSYGSPTIKYLTAIGYGACDSISGSSNGKKTCIGYNSGNSTNNTPSVFNTDTGEHIFIGGKPSSTYTRGFAGRSVLEVHNNSIDGMTYGNVVINSNLVVRGNFYPADENENVSYNVFTDTQTAGAENAYYRCYTDEYKQVLNFNNYVCKGLVNSNPKSVNMLIKGGICSTSDGYPNGNGCPNITSDKRLKYDITENNDGLAKILQLQPYNYSYKNDAKTPQVGVIAQDLQKVFPNAVSKDEKGFLQIRFEDMFYALINSIKELAQKVENVCSKIMQMNKDVLSVKSEQNDIRNQILVLDKRVRKLERK